MIPRTASTLRFYAMHAYALFNALHLSRERQPAEERGVVAAVCPVISRNGCCRCCWGQLFDLGGQLVACSRASTGGALGAGLWCVTEPLGRGLPAQRGGRNRARCRGGCPGCVAACVLSRLVNLASARSVRRRGLRLQRPQLLGARSCCAAHLLAPRFSLRSARRCGMHARSSYRASCSLDLRDDLCLPRCRLHKLVAQLVDLGVGACRLGQGRLALSRQLRCLLEVARRCGCLLLRLELATACPAIATGAAGALQQATMPTAASAHVCCGAYLAAAAARSAWPI